MIQPERAQPLPALRTVSLQLGATEGSRYDRPGCLPSLSGDGSPAGGNAFAPIFLHEVNIDCPITGVTLPRPEQGQLYGSIRSLVRLHSLPIGTIEIDCAGWELPVEDYAREIWRQLGSQINQHLQEDGLPPVNGLGPSGLPSTGQPECLRCRAELLARAPFISVVVCTRNRPESLQKCLRSAAHLDYPRFEVIVIDNAPSNGATLRITDNYRCLLPHLRYGREDRAGLSRARNRGLQLAEGTIVAFTDDDVAMDPNWLIEILRGFGAGPRVACVTGPIVPSELDTPAQVMTEQFGGFSRGFSRKVFDLGANRPGDGLYPYRAAVFGSGANIAFQKRMLSRIGGFDPALGAGTVARAGEEFAVFLQLLTAGYQIAYEPGALIYHTHHRDVEALKRQVYGYGVGMTAYLAKCLLENPGLIPDLFRRLPYAASFAIRKRQPRGNGQNHRDGCPPELANLELKGMIDGPLAYIRSRMRAEG